MTFDDYNYDMYNQYILVDPNYNENDDHPPLPKNFKPKMVQKTKKGHIKTRQSDTESMALTAKNLDDVCNDKYEHDVLDTQTEDEKAIAAYTKLMAQQEAEQAKEAVKHDSVSQAEGSQQNSQDDKTEEEYGEQEAEAEEEDEVEYEIFYDVSDIRQTLRKQEENMFKDLFSITKQVLQDNQTEKVMNKFHIEEWAPKENEDD